MSKELIEQLAKEHGHVNKWPNANHTGSTYTVEFSSNQLEAFAKAYQAAASNGYVQSLESLIQDADCILNGQNATWSKRHLEHIAKFHSGKAAAPIDVPPDEYDIVVDTGDGIYHTAELVHFQQEASKRSIQVKLAYAAPIDNVAEALQEIFDLCMKYQRSCYNTGYLHLADALLNIASKANTLIRAIPDTQAAPIESERE
jgi:hypothetical protein